MSVSRDKPLSAVERVKQESRGLRGDLADQLVAPADHFSGPGAQLLKFHGTYQQEDRDQRRERRGGDADPAHQFMVRCKIPGGVLSAVQYLVIDELADRYGNGTLRVTTRQGNQFHGVLKGDLKATIRAVNDALVTTLGACGDVVRNVVSCPAPVAGGLREQVLSVTRRLSDHLLPRTHAYHEIWLDGEQVAGGPSGGEAEPIYGPGYLPRKFKVAFAFPDDNCCDVHSNDLGFLVVAERGHLVGFNVLVGGGMGKTHGKEDTYPRLADALGFARTGEVVEVAEAVVKVQRDHGNRGDRRHARLKYLIDAQGLDRFRDEVERYLGRHLAPPLPVEVSGIEDHLGWHAQDDGRSFLGLFIENGRVQDGDGHKLRSALRRIVKTVHAGVRFTPQQNLLLTDIPDRRQGLVDRILADHGVARPGADAVSTVRRWSMACPALPTCGLALAEAERVLPDVIAELERELETLGLADATLTVRMTGCPNGCARPYTADLAFVGRSLNKYAVFVGGSMLGTRLATQYADLVHRDRLVTTVRPLFERYRDERLADERFGDFCDRVGVEALRSLRGAERGSEAVR
ncbi:MAG: NADPH-dependent assimilatory sulfite reductase hemoprotein subunit [Gemmatimonadetes bacterium]|nr:MAG: NADPH-dependent assimilatory sulfite reductase hemoprotein subunit [Gemmatimonadota bacterium]